MAQESTIVIQCVNGGYVLNTPGENDEGRTEVFTSTAKLTKAVRAAIEEYTLVPKTKADASDAE
jgi:hypothetical protein